MDEWRRTREMERGEVRRVQTEGNQCHEIAPYLVEHRQQTLQLFMYIVSRCFSFLRDRSGVWFLLRFLHPLVPPVPRSRGITVSRFGRFTWLRDRTCRIDGDVLHSADFEICLVLREKLLPVKQTLQIQRSNVS